MEVQNTFKIGDIVQLNSGGPKMTITSPFARNNSHLRECTYFDEVKGTFETAVFHVDSIQLFQDSTIKN